MTAKPKSGAPAKERKAQARATRNKANGKGGAGWRRDAVRQFRRNPLAGAGIAAGLGFVVGGGLASTAALRLLGKSALLVFQFAVLPALLGRLRDAIVDEVSDARLGS